MKIFSWVHRQFLRKDAKKDDNDKVALLENEGFAGACNGWNDGIILAIGTFGVDLYQDFKLKEDTFMSNKVMFVDVTSDDHDHDEEMESPLVQKASKHGVDHVEKHNLSPCDEVAKNNNHQEDDVVVKDLTKGKKSGERITLADLLRVDSEDNLLKNDELADDPKINVGNNNANKNGNTSTGSIKSFLVSKAKKKPGKDDSAQPIKKTKQFMRKMLRKKIHPTIGIQKMDVGHAHATS
ncbi:hypothetical protein HanPI659440_Chr16g0651711 [Helianthus annuus]|nr:hypothetical protein HanPI659440_Chr16g0651711 [Helianthus annuus]